MVHLSIKSFNRAVGMIVWCDSSYTKSFARFPASRNDMVSHASNRSWSEWLTAKHVCIHNRAQPLRTCTFVDDHVSTHTIMVQGGGDRRTYRCGQCKRRFMQQDPSTLTDVRLRNPKWVNSRAPEPPEGGKTRTRDHKQARAGDIRMGFHNASSIASAHVRKQYVRKMVAGMTIFAACETGLHGLEESDAIAEAEREPGIHATAITGGYVGAKSGIIVYIPKSDAIPRETICKRETGEPKLQILIVDYY